MKIPLRNFEQLIDPVILKRGLTYFKKGNVHQEGESSVGELFFIVQGTDEYEVSVVVEKEVIEDYTCDCPYADGPVCKHIVAVIFYLTQDALQLNEPVSPPKAKKQSRGRPRAAIKDMLSGPDLNENIRNELPLPQIKTSTRGKSSKSKKSGKVSTKTQIEDIIERLTPEEMKHYLVHHFLSNKTNLADFLAMFAPKNEHESVETYRRQIKSILRAAKGRHGFVDYRGASKVGSDIFAIAFSALTHSESGNFRSAMFISMAVLEEMTKALDFVDDSSGDVGTNLETAFGILSAVSMKSLLPELRQLLFDYAVQKYQGGEFEGWDWHLGMIEIAMNLVISADDETLLLNLLQQPGRNEYDVERRQSLIYALLLKRNDKTDAQKFLDQHLSNSDLKRIALERAFKNRDYERVKELANTAIQADKKTKPGLLSDWYDWLIKTAEAEGVTAQVIEYAKLQLLDHGREKESYFQMIKKYTPATEWITTYRKLIEEMSISRDWRTRELIPRILVAEQDWINLFGYLEHEAKTSGYSFYRLAQYGQHLIPFYKAEVGGLLQIALVTSAHGASKRRDYVDLTKDLRTMKKMGYGEIVKEIVHKMMAMYRHRPAMMEELRKL